MKFKKIDKIKDRVIAHAMMMLAAHRDCLWTQYWDQPDHQRHPNKIQFDCSDGYYGEFFGIFRGLKIAGYGYFGPCNLNAVEERMSDTPEHNLKWWVSQIEAQYKAELGDWRTATREDDKKLLDKYRGLVRAAYD